MLFWFFTWILVAPSAKAEVVKLTLLQALERALEHNGELRAEGAVLSAAQTEESRIEGEFGPRIEALAGIGPSYRVTGSALSSNDDKNVWGRTFLGKVTYTQPLLSFGRRGSYERAARAGVRVREAAFRVKQEEVRFQVKETYFGYLTATSLLEFVKEGKVDLERALGDRSKLAKKDQYRVDLFLAQVDAKEAELKRAQKLALEALQLRIGAAQEESFLPAEDFLDIFERKKESLEYYLNLSRRTRGEFVQLEEGVLAKKSLAKAENGAFLPVFALLASYDYADTNVRAQQQSRFAYDPYNRDAWAFGVGLKWDFQWGLPQAKAAKLRAEAEELEAKSTFAERGISTEVKKAYWEVEEAEELLRLSTNANKTSKKWLSGELMAIGSGLSSGKMEELAAAYVARAEAAKNYYQAILQHHMAWAGLSKALGQEVDPFFANNAAR